GKEDVGSGKPENVRPPLPPALRPVLNPRLRPRAVDSFAGSVGPAGVNPTKVVRRATVGYCRCFEPGGPKPLVRRNAPSSTAGLASSNRPGHRTVTPETR